MQCVILAAGEGTRMRPLTEHLPKPLIRLCDVPLLTHILNALPAAIDELIIVVGYKSEMIREYYGAEYDGKRITYVEQANPKAGTADALMYARGIARGSFLVLYADDIHGAAALERVVQTSAGMLAGRSMHPEKYGVLILNADGTLASILEKPKVAPSNLVNIGGFMLTEDVFAIHTKLSESGEYYLTDTVTEYAKTHPVAVIEQDLWIPVGCPDDIPKAEAVLCKN